MRNVSPFGLMALELRSYCVWSHGLFPRCLNPRGKKRKRKNASQIVSVSPSLWKTAARTALVPLCRAAGWSEMASQAKKKKTQCEVIALRQTHTHAHTRKQQIGLCCYSACNDEPNISFISLLQGLSAGEGQNNWEESLALLWKCHNSLWFTLFRCWNSIRIQNLVASTRCCIYCCIVSFF